MLIRSFRTQLTALYLAFFSLLFVLFSIFLYGELSRSLVGRLDDTLAAEADTAAVLFPDELQEMKGDAPPAARNPRRTRAPQHHAHSRSRRAHLRNRGLGVARLAPRRAGRGPPRHFHRPAPHPRARRAGRIRTRHAQPAPAGR